MTVRWKTEQRLSEHFTVKCSSRSEQRSRWTKVNGHHDDPRSKYMRILYFLLFFVVCDRPFTIIVKEEIKEEKEEEEEE